MSKSIWHNIYTFCDKTLNFQQKLFFKKKGSKNLIANNRYTFNI